MKRPSEAELRAMTPAQLEAEANKLLYGQPTQPVRGTGVQGDLNYGVYLRPKNVVMHRKDNGQPITCRTCGRLRSKLSGKQCRACYQGDQKRRRAPRDVPLEAPEFGFENGERVQIYRDYAEEDAP